MLSDATSPSTFADSLQHVNLSDAGVFETMAALDSAGIAIEAEVHSAEEADALTASRYGNRVARVVIGVDHLSGARARREAAAIDATLRANGARANILAA